MLVDFFHLIHTRLVITSKKSIWHHTKWNWRQKYFLSSFSSLDSYFDLNLSLWDSSVFLQIDFQFNIMTDIGRNLVETSLVNLSSLLLVLTWIWVFEILQSFFSDFDETSFDFCLLTSLPNRHQQQTVSFFLYIN